MLFSENVEVQLINMIKIKIVSNLVHATPKRASLIQEMNK